MHNGGLSVIQYVNSFLSHGFLKNSNFQLLIGCVTPCVTYKISLQKLRWLRNKAGLDSSKWRQSAI